MLSIDGPGTSIAERPVFDGGNYPASAQRSLPRLYSSSASRTSPRYAFNSLKSRSRFASRWRTFARLVEIIEELSFTTVRHRLPALLVRLAKAEAARPG